MTKGERWRGQMPFRRNARLWTEPLKQQGRGGESSLADTRPWAAEVLHWMRWMDGIRAKGHGKSYGSFTEHVRQEFRAWQERNGLDAWSDPITFEYRLHRRQRVVVSIVHPAIFHRKIRGDGSKGFVLEGRILSIDGLPPARRYQTGEFALTRIIGRHPIRLLAEGQKVLE